MVNICGRGCPDDGLRPDAAIDVRYKKTDGANGIALRWSEQVVDPALRASRSQTNEASLVKVICSQLAVGKRRGLLQVGHVERRKELCCADEGRVARGSRL